MKFTILGKDFSSFGGELSMLIKYSAMTLLSQNHCNIFTGETMKPKRHVIKSKYKDVISAMYTDSGV